MDNEPDVVRLVKSILEDAGYDVVTALSGEEGLEKLEKEKPDLILLDIMMPDLSGWDVYDRVRKIDRKIKVVLLSVLEVSHKRKEMLKKQGISGYIMKPFKGDELVKSMKTILTSRTKTAQKLQAPRITSYRQNNFKNFSRRGRCHSATPNNSSYFTKNIS